jgi:hypothetical protein
MHEKSDQSARLSHMVVSIQAGILAFVFAVIGGLGLFLVTAWLLVKGGEHVGAHLNLLGQYLIGYSVTWTGSLVGLIYGAVIGGVLGWSIGKLYNLIAQARQRAGKKRTT